MAARNSVNDFIRDILARNGASGVTGTYSAVINTGDGSVQISKNGVVLFSRVLWNTNTRGAVTDSSFPNGDLVNVQSASGEWSVGSAQNFINSLT